MREATLKILDGRFYETPTKFDVAHAMTTQEGVYSGFMHTLRLLLLAGFSLLLCVSPARGQGFVITDRPGTTSIVITERSDDAETEYYVVMYTADWCGLCKAYANDGHLDRLKKQLHVKVVNTDTEKRWHKGRIPCFWLCERKGSIPVYKWAPGAVSPETIDLKIKEIRRKRSSVVEVGFYSASVYNGRSNSSHQNRATLIRHLSQEGIHAGRRSVEVLEMMADVELDALHNADHKWNAE